jgi:hypothetical protein
MILRRPGEVQPSKLTPAVGRQRDCARVVAGAHSWSTSKLDLVVPRACRLQYTILDCVLPVASVWGNGQPAMVAGAASET